MSLRFNNRTRQDAVESLNRASARMRDGARWCSERVGPAGRQARVYTARRVVDARSWGAPRLERAAIYVEKDLAPRMGSALHRSADLVEPARQRGKRLAVGLLAVGGMLGAAGAGVFALRRASSRSVEAEEPDETAADIPSPNGAEARTQAS